MATQEVARAESERGELVLREREGGTLELRANGVFVMDTAETTSERALARQALARHDRPESVLVGGLGLGFTLAEVLADARVRRVVAAEIEPALVGWLRDGTVPHGPALLADPRLEVREADVRDVVEPGAAYDLVLLDVDNGPAHLVHQANAAIYDRAFLARTRAAMSADGLLSVWSAAHDQALHEALRDVFGDAEASAYAVDLQGRAERYWLHGARVRSGT